MKAYRYSGAGNTFVVADGRTQDCSSLMQVDTIARLCREHNTDGLMVLVDEPGWDFRMHYFNSDGSGGMMCGNGGRCIVAFADFLGIVPAEGQTYRFVAADGPHTGVVTERKGEVKTVTIQMIDVKGATPYNYLDGLDGVTGWFLNTGTRHFVTFVEDVDAVDVETLGARIRRHPAFAPEGTNVNFVQPVSDGIRVRTFEKGCECETLACGTGIVASALASYVAQKAPAVTFKFGGVRNWNYAVHARRDDLAVDFNEGTDGLLANCIHLTGPAEQTDVLDI